MYNTKRCRQKRHPLTTRNFVRFEDCGHREGPPNRLDT